MRSIDLIVELVSWIENAERCFKSSSYRQI